MKQTKTIKKIMKLGDPICHMCGYICRGNLTLTECTIVYIKEKCTKS